MSDDPNVRAALLPLAGIVAAVFIAFAVLLAAACTITHVHELRGRVTCRPEFPVYSCEFSAVDAGP